MSAIAQICKDMDQAKRCRTLKRPGARMSPVYGVFAAKPQKARTCKKCGVTYHGEGECPICAPRALEDEIAQSFVAYRSGLGG